MTQFDMCLRELIFFQKGRGGRGERYLFLFWLFPKGCFQFPKWHSSSQCVPQEIPCNGGVLSLTPLLYLFSSSLIHHTLWNFTPSPPLFGDPPNFFPTKGEKKVRDGRTYWWLFANSKQIWSGSRKISLKTKILNPNSCINPKPKPLG